MQKSEFDNGFSKGFDVGVLITLMGVFFTLCLVARTVKGSLICGGIGCIFLAVSSYVGAKYKESFRAM
ncbi:hypothetical protein [Methanococcus maripaludis]|nr:hypothetical protein [Methanococcus maripaludis]